LSGGREKQRGDGSAEHREGNGPESDECQAAPAWDPWSELYKQRIDEIRKARESSQETGTRRHSGRNALLTGQCFGAGEGDFENEHLPESAVRCRSVRQARGKIRLKSN